MKKSSAQPGLNRSNLHLLMNKKTGVVMALTQITRVSPGSFVPGSATKCVCISFLPSMRTVFLYLFMWAALSFYALTTYGQNTKLGTNALANNTTGTNNTAIGASSLFTNTTSSNNTAVGTNSLYANTSGNHNTASGFQALMRNTTGIHNTATGAYAMFSNTTGNSNTATGFDAMYNNTSGINNSAFGMYSLNKNTTGVNNTASGYAALYTNKTASNNTAHGAYSLNKNTTGGANTALGSFSLTNNTTGADNTAIGASSLTNNTTGLRNTASGRDAMRDNTSGINNTANGWSSLLMNTTGSENTASGLSSLRNNATGSGNTATGTSALTTNSNGSYNTATGTSSLQTNYSGYENTANGLASLFSNNTGFRNTACGTNTLYLNRTAANNTAVGYSALYHNTTGANNTAIGTNADVSTGDLTNATAIGYQAVVDKSNKVRVGNTSVTSIGGQVSWTTFSDGRFKKDIKENVPGLAFINNLRPVTYTVNVKEINEFYKKAGKPVNENEIARDENTPTNPAMEKEESMASKILYNGFVAQEVEAAAKKINYDFGGVDKPETAEGLYGLRYNDFVAPLVKAVQELSRQNEDLQKQVNELRKITESNSQQQKIQNVQLTGATLSQNAPNPFNRTTIINFTLPQKYSSAKIIIADKYGKMIKEANVSGSGKGSLPVSAALLASGAYSYSLYVDNRLVVTRHMVLEK